MPPKSNSSKKVESLKHDDATRKNIPTAEYQSVMAEDEKSPIRVAYDRRNRDLDPQLVWRGKDEQDWSDLVVNAPPLYIQEKVHPKVLIDDLMQRTELRQDAQLDLFADFNGIPDEAKGTEFYQHDAHWTNRMILGDSLQVMASLAEREGLRGKVQCIYIDPPYGIKFNSNFQWSTKNRNVRDGKPDHITREPEQVKAFRDTWRDGIHSYLTYLRDRLTVTRDLLTDSGSVFVQIGDENVHRVRLLLDEIFGDENFISEVILQKTSGQDQDYLDNTCDVIIWFAKSKQSLKYRQIFIEKSLGGKGASLDQFRFLEMPNGERRSLTKDEKNNYDLIASSGRIFRHTVVTSRGSGGDTVFPIELNNRTYLPPVGRHWSTHQTGMERLIRIDRITATNKSLNYVKFFDDFPAYPLNNLWNDVATTSFGGRSKEYVVETNPKIIERCILMTTDPGDLVIDPTCGSGSTAYVAEQWGRRWITIDTSRVALALARARIMGARYPYYLLKDSKAGQEKEAELKGGKWLVASGSSGNQPPTTNHQPPTFNNIRQGFVYDRVPHITLKAIANNAEIDVIWEQFQPKVEQALADLNAALQGHSKPYPVTTGGREGKKIDFTASGTVKLPSGETAPANALLEWEVPREKPTDWPDSTQAPLAAFWNARIARQKEIDASIAASADQEFLYDKPYEDKSVVRVAGPFTVESLSPHRVLAVDENDELVASGQWLVDGKQDPLTTSHSSLTTTNDFANVILETLKVSGVQQPHKEDKITFSSLTGWPGEYICAEGRYVDEATGQEKRAGIFIGPEFGTVSREDLVRTARECGDAGFDVAIACAFNYDAHSADFSKLGRIPVLKARMNADLHMADTLKNTGAGNLFVIFGEPDIDVVSGQWLVASNGRLVVNYDIVAELSGLRSLEEINRLGREDLPSLQELSPRREVRSDGSTAEGSSVSSREHSGGGSSKRDGGVSSISEHRQRVSGGSRNVADSGSSSGIYRISDSRNTDAGSRHHWTDAQRAKAIAALETLTSSDFPLTLTTNHQTQVTIYGVDVFHPQSGEVRSSNPDEIACWFIDTDYNDESFFVRHAYFLGANDPYKSLKSTLKAEIDEDAWESLYGSISRPFAKPKSGRIAVKVINHLGDEVMKVFSVG